ncbi:hypothetical protein [Deinococcus cellulosilyticus]
MNSFAILPSVTEELMTGRFHGAAGYDVRCALDGDFIKGRVGGKLAGKSFNLEITETGVQGTAAGLNVEVHLQDGALVGSIGDQELTLRGVDRVTGRLGGPIVGWDVAAQQTGHKLVGRLGGTVIGKDFEFNLGEAPGWIGVLVALVSFYVFEQVA